VGVVSRGNGAQRNDLGERNPEPLLRRSVNSPVIRCFFCPRYQTSLRHGRRREWDNVFILLLNAVILFMHKT
jgi:hypothetical protein